LKKTPQGQMLGSAQEKRKNILAMCRKNGKEMKNGSEVSKENLEKEGEGRECYRGSP